MPCGPTWTCGDVRLNLDVSIGSAVAPTDGSTAEQLLQRADVAMYRAKKGRTGYEPYDARLDGSGSERLALYTELRHAVADELIDVHFQPSLDPVTGRVLSAEALARWQHPVRGAVAPDTFIPLAERSGLINALTHLVLRRALARLRDWRAEALLPRVAVNLSPRVLHDLELPGTGRIAAPRVRRPRRGVDARDHGVGRHRRPRARHGGAARAWTPSASTCRSTTTAPATPRSPTCGSCRSTS